MQTLPFAFGSMSRKCVGGSCGLADGGPGGPA